LLASGLVPHASRRFFVGKFSGRINKKNSQKDAEQKRNGNYFFYDDGADDSDDEDFDDI
jgi:hypothetical protein